MIVIKIFIYYTFRPNSPEKEERMKKIYLLIFLALGILTASFAIVQQDYSNVEIKTTKVAGNVYMLQGRGGNIGVSVGEDGVLMVDDQFAPLQKRSKPQSKN